MLNIFFFFYFSVCEPNGSSCSNGFYNSIKQSNGLTTSKQINGVSSSPSSSSTSSSHPPSSVADPEKLEALKMDVI